MFDRLRGRRGGAVASRQFASAGTACVLGAFALGQIGLLGLAAPASADTQAFLHGLEERFSFMTADELLAAGHRACAIIDAGNPGATASGMLDREFGIGESVAIEIVKNASLYLGC
jgi:hypothetical protein